MSSVVIAGNTSGTITLDAPNVAGTTVLTLPTANGTVLTSASSQVTGPAFSAYAGTTTSLSTNTWTKVTINTEDFDTNNNFASSRFTPTVAGYYQVNATILIAGSGSATTVGLVGVYKNGTIILQGTTSLNTTVNSAISVCSGIVYLNGSTDYIELYGYQNSGGSLNAVADATSTKFSASMVRGA